MHYEVSKTLVLDGADVVAGGKAQRCTRRAQHRV